MRNAPVSLSLPSGGDLISVKHMLKSNVDDENIVFNIETLRGPTIKMSNDDRLKLLRL